MTLATDVYVIRATVTPRDLFHLGRKWLGCTERHVFEEQARHPVHGQPGYVELGNKLGQGLPAIWEVVWCPDGPYRVEEHVCKRDDDGYSPDPDCNAFDCDPGPACAYKAWFDTSYGYRADNGADCNDLHAYLIWEIAQAVGEDNIRWNADTIGDDLPFSDLARLGDWNRGRIIQ